LVIELLSNLNSILKGRISSNDIILIPTAYLALLLPLQQWLSSFSHGKRPNNIQIHFHFEPSHGFFSGETEITANNHFIKVIGQLNELKSIRWSANQPRLSTLINQLSSIPVRVIEMPRVIPVGIKQKLRQDRRIRFLFIGSPRIEKGFNSILSILSDIISTTSRCDFRFVLNYNLPNASQFLASFPRQRVELIVKSDLLDQEYYSEISQTDYVLCLYHAASYRFRSSGIMLDAALLNIPVILTRGMASEDSLTDSSRIHVLNDVHELVDLCHRLEN